MISLTFFNQPCHVYLRINCTNAGGVIKYLTNHGSISRKQVRDEMFRKERSSSCTEALSSKMLVYEDRQRDNGARATFIVLLLQYAA